jgi:hypothetical protein
MRQLRKRAIAYGYLVVLAGLFACSRPEPKSAIVERAEQAGSGSLAAVSKDGMREWRQAQRGGLSGRRAV